MMKKFILPIIIIVIDPELLFKTTQGKFEMSEYQERSFSNEALKYNFRKQ